MNKDEEIAWNLLAHYITAKNIITIVEKRTGINIREQTRKREVSDARHIAMYLIKENTCLSYKQTARACGLQSHSTAWYACKQVKNLMSINRDFKEKYGDLIEHEGANYKVHFTIPIVKEPDESKMKDKTFELAERLADEAFGSKGVIEYSSRQELTSKFYEMLKETLIEL